MFRLLSLGIIIVCLFGIGLVSLGLLFEHPGTQGIRRAVLTQLTFFMSAQGRRIPFLRKDPRQQQLDTLAQTFFEGEGGTYAIVVEDITTGMQSAVNEHLVMQSASLYKLFVMAAWFDRFEKEGKTMDSATRESIERMITISSNADGERLGAQYGWRNLTEWAREQGFGNTTLTNIPPLTDAADIARFYKKLYLGELVSQKASQEMLVILRQQEINDRIPKYLPEGVIVAHKTGEWAGIRHDAGIVEGERGPFIIVLMAKDLKNIQLGKDAMAEFSREVFDFLAQPPERQEIL